MMAVLKERHFLLRMILTLVGCSILFGACASETQPLPTATPPEPTSAPTIGTNIKVELPEGDLANGDHLARVLGCKDCHIEASFALLFESGEGLARILERGEMRMADPAYEGSASTNEEYIIESIVLPEVYLIEGAWGGNFRMLDHFGEILTAQDLADILIWLETFD
jgi:hypothetical protein